jgi:type 1 glutamine amidotransferase
MLSTGKSCRFYSTFGYHADAYAAPENVRRIGKAIGWAPRLKGSGCGGSVTASVQEVAR